MPQSRPRRSITPSMAVRAFKPVMATVFGLPVPIATVYWMKSAAGIDLMAGPSPLYVVYWR